MNAIIDAAIDRSRAVLLILLLIFIAGSISYSNIPRETSPDVQIPIIYVSLTQEGISPLDAERMLVKPLEIELRSVEGVKEMRSVASQGRASVTLEFQAGFDSDKALTDVRDKVDLAKSEFPEEADEPVVNEVNFSLFPVISVILTGNVPERTFIKIARDLRDEIEAIPDVLNVDIAGDREEELDIIIDPLLIQSYGLSRDVLSTIRGNNVLVAAGAMENDVGSYGVKVPGLLETLEDVLTLPLKVNGDAVVTVEDISSVRKTYKDPQGFARVNGKRSVALEVSKRSGKNMIQTIDQVRAAVESAREFWPDGIEVVYAQDQSGRVVEMLNDLQNSIVFAMLLVMIVIIAVIGVRSASFVAVAIPGAFLFGIIALDMMGLTLNIVVMFSLILSIGILVDSAIVITEYADRQMIEGVSYKKAYINAAKRMSWPIIASTLTTIAVFTPLLVWPGVVGQFMKYMPITIIAVLGGSLLMALIFLPTLGTYLGKKSKVSLGDADKVNQAETGDIWSLGGFTGKYVRALKMVIDNAGVFASGLFVMLCSVYVIYSFSNFGMEFFPNIEPDNVQAQIRARGNLSVYEKDRLVAQVEERILDLKEDVKIFYTRSGKFDTGSGQLAEDVVGVIQLELHDWDTRRKAAEILEDIRNRTSDMAGVIIETRKEEKGPSSGKPFELQVSSRILESLSPAVEKILEKMENVGGFIDVEDSRPVPAIEWEADINREQAIKYGLTAEAVGDFVKLVTKGLKVTSYRPDEAEDEVDVMLRYPEKDRNFNQLNNLRVITANGAVPLSNFVKVQAKNKVSRIERVDAKRVYKVKADVEKGVLISDKVKAMTERLKTSDFSPDVSFEFKGEDEDQKEAMVFLASAFGLALFAMGLILVVQFNSIYHMFIIMSAVFLSTVGVLLGLLVTAQPFGVVMCGVGVISLAGIVVNNNIIFIDTYSVMRSSGMPPEEALLRTGAQRMRPILLTAGTTVLGLIPMVFAMQIDFIDRDLAFGAPSTQWWRQLSTTIAGGLTFATVLTLFFTPALLILGERLWKRNAG